ncbi:MAG: hypothetical protein H6622_18305 [Halobacteriovoraceae bacterium]|nr:hypothetical protein [Halobacteriovoraceae bacterium]
MIKHIENIYSKKKRTKQIKEYFGLSDSFKIKNFKHGYYLKNALISVEDLEKNKEILSDIFSSEIFLIKRISKKYGNDFIAIYTKGYKKRKYNGEVSTTPLSSMVGYDFEGDLYNRPFSHSFINKPIIYIGGGIGAGKSIQGNIILKSFLLQNEDYKAIIIDPKSTDFFKLSKEFSNRAKIIKPKNILDFKNILTELINIENEILNFQNQLTKRKIIVSNWNKLSSRPKYIMLIDEASEIIPRVSINKNTPDDEKEIITVQIEIAKILKRMIKLYRYTSSFFLILLNQDTKVDSINIGWENIKTKILYNQPTTQQSIQLVGSSILKDNTLFNGKGYYISEGIIKKFQAPFFNTEFREIEKIPQYNSQKINKIIKKKLKDFHKGFVSQKSQEKFKFVSLSEYEIRQLGKNYYHYYLSLLPELRKEAIREINGK